MPASVVHWDRVLPRLIIFLFFFKEWRSDKLWDHYVKWETTLESEKEIGTKNYSKVLALYDRILANPTQGLTHQFDMFKEFVKVHEPKGKKKKHALKR